uniref:Uncharacterized protein n=1 Tax=Oryza sativa subsp. japonica TaxID=39947 RepID=Q6YTN2_ORYSJ|nr:hypothetical protein [Oryza sativa Japonica Group]
MQQPHCVAVAESTVRLKMTSHMITIEVAEALCDDVDNVQMDRLGMDKVRMAAYLYIMNMVQMATCIFKPKHSFGVLSQFLSKVPWWY